jgi:diacylglycerol O-acyltransferase/trehalose O-mycolyltransferase
MTKLWPRRLLRGALVAAMMSVWCVSPVNGTPADITVLSATALTSRLTEYTIATPLLPNPVGVRILLPSEYSTAHRYPVLYLLHGGNGNETDWTDSGDAEAISAGDPLIIVMPDASLYPSYANWQETDSHGFRPQWETFHTDALVHWVDSTFSTVASRAGRAVAGVSVGGFGAFSYAARHPDLYVDAASFSGQLDSNGDELLRQIASAMDNGNPATPYYGPRVTEEVQWRGHNPVDLAANLRVTSLHLWTGNGIPGPLDAFPALPDALEITVHHESISMHTALNRLGIPSEWTDYGRGTHNWPYWQRDLAAYLPRLMTVFGQARPDPASFEYRSIDPSYTEFGWSVHITRPAAEFSDLTVSGHTVTLTGSGTATIRTPPDYQPGRSYPVTVRGDDIQVTAASDGTLTVPVRLGSSARCQEYTFLCGTRTHQAQVTIGS